MYYTLVRDHILELLGGPSIGGLLYQTSKVPFLQLQKTSQAQSDLQQYAYTPRRSQQQSANGWETLELHKQRVDATCEWLLSDNDGMTL